MNWNPRFPLVAILLFVGVVPAAAQDGDPNASERVTGPVIARIAVCEGVDRQEPVGESERFPADVGRLFCFTDVRNAEGQKVVHTWIQNGTTRARVELEIKGPRWRTWSSKRILPEWTGAWEVKILSEEGLVLGTHSFVVE